MNVGELQKSIAAIAPLQDLLYLPNVPLVPVHSVKLRVQETWDHDFFRSSITSSVSAAFLSTDVRWFDNSMLFY